MRAPVPSRERARTRRPVEAIEHVRQVGLVNAGPVVTHGKRSALEGDVDRAARLAPFDRVVEQVVDGSFEPGASGDEPVWLERALEAQLWLPMSCALDRCRDQLVEGKRPRASTDRPSRAADQIADQRRQLIEPLTAASSTYSPLGRQVRGGHSRMLARCAVSGRTRARGVRNQLLLHALRLVQGGHHRVEVGREAGEFVSAPHRDALVELAGHAHLAHRSGKRSHRAKDCIRRQTPEQCGRKRSTKRQGEQEPPDTCDRRIRLRQRARRPDQTIAQGQTHRVERIATSQRHVAEIRRYPTLRDRALSIDQRDEPVQCYQVAASSAGVVPARTAVFSATPRLGMTWK